MSSRRPPAPQRIGPFNVYTNMFQVTGIPRSTFTQYRVDIIPSRSSDASSTVLPPRRAAEIIDKLQLNNPERFNPRAIYDGRELMFSTNPHLSDTYEVRMSANPNSDRGVFRVHIKSVGSIQPGNFQRAIEASTGLPSGQDADVINLLQLVVKQAANRKHGIIPQARHFITAVGAHTIPRGLIVCRGYFQSVRPLSGRLLVNVDIVHMAVYQEGSLSDIALEFFRNPEDRGARGARGVRDARDLAQITPDQFRKLQSFLKGVRVRSAFPKEARRSAAFRPIGKLVPRAGFFEFTKDESGIPTTVQRYFRDKYNYSLRHPDIFGVEIRGAVLPAEVCEVAPLQPYKRKLAPDQQQQMLKHSITHPRERLQYIRGAVSGPVQQFDYETSDIMGASGMAVHPEPLRLTGTVLPHPQVTYGGGSVQPQRGGWNVRNQKFVRPRPIETWGVVSFDLDTLDNVVERFVANLTRNLTNLGIYPQITPPKIHVGNTTDILKSLDTGARKASPGMDAKGTPLRPTFLLIILPREASAIKHQVKYWGNMLASIATQCVRSGKYNEKGDDQYCNNVALKIHAKIGGTNSIAHSPMTKLLENGIVIGCDVSHPGPGIKNRPSIASLVASIDPQGTRYAAFASVQEPHTEMIEQGSLKDMLRSAILETDWSQRKLERVIVFRDGVSEGEYATVMAQEVDCIKEVLKGAPKGILKNNEIPRLVFIVVTKRHHVRFFPADPSQVDRDGNCPAGFLVDRDIVYSGPVEDFYLQSHAGLLGTSRPSHYVILKNEVGLSKANIQELSYTLCHNYAAATRIVSIPAPVYYADRVCSYVTYNMPYDADESSEVSGNDQVFNLSHWKAKFRDSNLKRQFYFL